MYVIALCGKNNKTLADASQKLSTYPQPGSSINMPTEWPSYFLLPLFSQPPLMPQTMTLFISCRHVYTCKYDKQAVPKRHSGWGHQGLVPVVKKRIIRLALSECGSVDHFCLALCDNTWKCAFFLCYFLLKKVRCFCVSGRHPKGWDKHIINDVFSVPFFVFDSGL